MFGRRVCTFRPGTDVVGTRIGADRRCSGVGVVGGGAHGYRVGRRGARCGCICRRCVSHWARGVFRRACVVRVGLDVEACVPRCVVCVGIAWVGGFVVVGCLSLWGVCRRVQIEAPLRGSLPPLVARRRPVVGGVGAGGGLFGCLDRGQVEGEVGGFRSPCGSVWREVQAGAL